MKKGMALILAGTLFIGSLFPAYGADFSSGEDDDYILWESENEEIQSDDGTFSEYDNQDMEVFSSGEDLLQEGQLENETEIYTLNKIENIDGMTGVRPYENDSETESEFDDGVLFSASEENNDDSSEITKAAELLREKMVQRQNRIVINLKLSSVPDAEELQNTLLEEALKETGNSWEGDYLNFHIAYLQCIGIHTDDSYELTFDVVYYTTYEQEQIVSSAIASAISSLGITASTSEYNRIKKIYDYICQNVAYDHSCDATGMLKYSAYAAIVNHSAVCQGYSLLMYRMLREVGISSRLITGESRAQKHMWNIIALKGLYYNADATWDAGWITPEYFLKCDGKFQSDHMRDERCSTASYYEQHPMGQTDYVLQDDDVFAENGYEENGIVYNILNDEAIVVGYKGTPIEIVLPEYVKGAVVKKIDQNAFYGCQDLKKVVIAESSKINDIGDFAFAGCSKLSQINLPSSIKKLGLSAFQDCISLEVLTLPEGLKTVSQNSLANTGLHEIHIPSTVTEFDSTNNGSCLERITVEAGNKKYTAENGALLWDAFSTGYKEFVLYPYGKKEAEYQLPDCVKNVDCSTFADSLYLKKIIVGKNHILSNAHMMDCSEITVDRRNSYYRSEDGILYSKDMEHLICIPRKREGDIVIPEGVKVVDSLAGANSCIRSVTFLDGLVEIGDSAFFECVKLEMTVLPDTLEKIGINAFLGCSVLSDVILPGKITEIDEQAFAQCYGLERIVIPELITRINSKTFMNCVKLTEVEIPKGVEYIAGDAFYGCPYEKKLNSKEDFIIWNNTLVKYTGNARNVVIPDYITRINNGAFSACRDVISITIPSSVESIGQWAFSECDSLSLVVIPDSVKTIGAGAFFMCPKLVSAGPAGGGYNIEIGWKDTLPAHAFEMAMNLQKVVVPTGISVISQSAFKECTGLKEIIFPDTVRTVGNEAFESTEWYQNQCDDFVMAGSVLLKYNGPGGDVVLPKGITEIYDRAFWHYSSLKKVVVPDGVTAIGRGAFEACDYLEVIDIPDSVLTIGDNCFAGCARLKNVKLPGALSKINKMTFAACDNLAEVIIPNSVTMIEENAFWSDFSLTKMVLPNRLKTIGDSAFSYSAISEIVLPDTLETIGDDAFYGCENLKNINLPEKLQRIGNRAFGDCKALEHITIPSSVKKIGTCVFVNCTQLTSAGAENCSINFKWTESIPDYAFIGCSSLKEVIIASTVSQIGKNAFEDCDNLKNVRYKGDIEGWENIRISSGNDVLSRAEKQYEIVHQWSAWKTTKEPTCKATGERQKICSSCGRVITEMVPVVGHAWNTHYTVEKAPSCEEVGQQSIHCGVCDLVKEESTKIIPAKGHQWSEWSTDSTKEPTCKKTGERQKTCSCCGSVITEILPAVGHAWNLYYTVEKAPTCEEAGQQSIHCGVCDLVKEGSTKIIPAKGHQWSKWSTASKATVFAAEKQKRTCLVCGMQETKTVGSKLKPAIKLNYSSLILKAGQSTNVVKVSGLAYGDSVRSWKSSNTRIVKVDSKGKITAQKTTGKATITVTLASKKTAKISVSVQKSTVKTKTITGLNTKIILAKGKKATLKPVRNPITSAEKITYSSSNTKIVSVTSSSVVQARAAGTARITVRSGTAKFIVTISVPKTKTTSISNVKKAITIQKGKTYTLKPRLSPSNSDEKITYTSLNKKIATVNSKGVIKGVGRGKTVVTVKSGSKTVKCTVTVK